jgi:hypothetical protein
VNELSYCLTSQRRAHLRLACTIGVAQATPSEMQRRLPDQPVFPARSSAPSAAGFAAIGDQLRVICNRYKGEGL